MSWIPAPRAEIHDERTPVTVCLSPVQAVRLEVLLAQHRAIEPSVDDNDLVDQIFARGLDQLEAEACR